MYREILEKLVEWKDKPARKILFLAGQKGVGKTYILRDFGDGCFNYTVYIDLEKQDYIRVFFEDKPSKTKLINILEISGSGDLVAGETFIVLENIDALKNMGEVLSFLCEQMGEYHIAVTSSVREKSIYGRPDVAGKLELMQLYPLSFKEFLSLLGQQRLVEGIEKSRRKAIKEEDKTKLDYYIRLYFYMGGMPSVMQKYIDTGSIQAAAEEKARLLGVADETIGRLEDKPFCDRVKKVWRSIPFRLEKENKKLQPGEAKLTDEVKDCRDAEEWLYNNKYIDKAYRVKEPVSPLCDNIDEEAYEVFYTDIGFLSCMYGLSYEDIKNADNLEKLCGGSLVQQFVYQEFTANENVEDLYYWESEEVLDIEFIFEYEGDVIPVGINLSGNAKAKGIKAYKDRYNINMYISITKDIMRMADCSLKLPIYGIWGL